MVTAIAAAAAYTLILVLLPFTRTHGADEVQRLSLPPLWSFSADLSFPSSSPSTLNSYSHIAPFSLFVPILSSAPFASGSKGFSFGFLSLFPSPSSPPSQISLSICLGVQQRSDGSSSPFLLPVWTLNTTKPLKQQGKALVKLKVDDNEQLSLSDGDGRVVWTLSKVHSMEMQRNGNVVIIDSSNESIWQSFEHPSDCLLQGQRLRMGMEMTSSNSMYKAAMQAGGLVFYEVSANPLPLVYSVFAANKTVQNNISDALISFSLDKDAPINLTSSLGSPSCAILNKSMAYFVLDGDRYTVHDACANNNFLSINTTADLIRLDADGIMRDYYVQQLPNSSYEVTSSRSNYRPCNTPNVCGAYGICLLSYTSGTDNLHSCRCPTEQDNKNLSNVFTFMDISNPSQGCTRTVPLECEQASSQSLVEIQGVFYRPVIFSLFELTWKDNTKSLQDCKASCLSNCSCSGLVYHTKSSFCLPFGDTTPLSNVSFAPVSSQEHIAFVKIQLTASKSKSHSTIVAIGVTVPVVIIIIIVSAIYWKWKKHMDLESKLAEEEVLAVLPVPPTRYSYKELTRFTQAFSKRLGSGGFGSVYEGVLPDGRRVAVKNLELLSQAQKEFLAEIASIGGINHVNIVNLYGFCLEKQRRLLVYEYMENGSLDKWLFCKAGEQQMQHVMSWETRYNVAVGTARGLAYLHEECPKPILHLDVKPQNILLDGNFDAKLGDFGLARLVARDQQSSVITVVKGTPGYIAPELVSRSIVSKKCDVYSFGMVLLELVSGRKHVDNMETSMGSEDWYFPKWAAKKAKEEKVAELMDKRLVGAVACDHEAISEDSDQGATIMEQVKTVVRVALSCIHEEPEMRPSMAMVCGMLEGSVAFPINDISAAANAEFPADWSSSSGTVDSTMKASSSATDSAQSASTDRGIISSGGHLFLPD